MSEKLDIIKTHFKENKKIYIGIGIGVAIGVTTTIVIHNKNTMNNETVKVLNEFKGAFYKPIITNNNIVTTQLVRQGHPGNIIVCNETGVAFASQNQAAAAMGLNAGQLAQHLKGRFDSVKGYTFEKLGEAV